MRVEVRRAGNCSHNRTFIAVAAVHTDWSFCSCATGPCLRTTTSSSLAQPPCNHCPQPPAGGCRMSWRPPPSLAWASCAPSQWTHSTNALTCGPSRSRSARAAAGRSCRRRSSCDAIAAWLNQAHQNIALAPVSHCLNARSTAHADKPQTLAEPHPNACFSSRMLYLQCIGCLCTALLPPAPPSQLAPAIQLLPQ